MFSMILKSIFPLIVIICSNQNGEKKMYLDLLNRKGIKKIKIIKIPPQRDKKTLYKILTYLLLNFCSAMYSQK